MLTLQIERSVIHEAAAGLNAARITPPFRGENALSLEAISSALSLNDPSCSRNFPEPLNERGLPLAKGADPTLTSNIKRSGPATSQKIRTPTSSPNRASKDLYPTTMAPKPVPVAPKRASTSSVISTIARPQVPPPSRATTESHPIDHDTSMIITATTSATQARSFPPTNASSSRSKLVADGAGSTDHIASDNHAVLVGPDPNESRTLAKATSIIETIRISQGKLDKTRRILLDPSGLSVINITMHGFVDEVDLSSLRFWRLS